jgi:hypothetical protein
MRSAEIYRVHLIYHLLIIEKINKKYGRSCYLIDFIVN